MSTETASPCPVVAGPVKSDRLGTCIGVDLGSLDLTLAVSRENRMPRASVVVTTAARQLMRWSKEGLKSESVVVFGSEVDPTLHPKFKEITENLRDLRNKWFARSKLVLHSTSPQLADYQARHALVIYDQVIARLEGGTQKTFHALSGRPGGDLPELSRQLSQLDNLIVETRFFRGSVDTTTPNEVRGWIKRLEGLKLRELHFLHPEKPARGKMRAAPRSVLDTLAAQVTEKLGVPVRVFEDVAFFTEHAAAVPPTPPGQTEQGRGPQGARSSLLSTGA